MDKFEFENWVCPDLNVALSILYNEEEDDVGQELSELLKTVDFSEIPPPDFPHQKHHVETVEAYVNFMIEKVEIDSKIAKKLQIALRLHDISYGYLRKYNIPLIYHSVISEVIAYMITGDKEISDLVYFHNVDVNMYPDDGRLKLAISILRDADQIAWMGYSGLIRFFYYNGNKYLEMFSEDFVTENLSDTRITKEGLPVDIDANPRAFVLEQLLPRAIHSKRVLKKMRENVLLNITRFFGEKGNSHRNFLTSIIKNQDLAKAYADGNISYSDFLYRMVVVDGMDMMYERFFIRKMILEVEILDIVDNMLSYIAKGGRNREKYYKKLVSRLNYPDFLKA